MNLAEIASSLAALAPHDDGRQRGTRGVLSGACGQEAGMVRPRSHGVCDSDAAHPSAVLPRWGKTSVPARNAPRHTLPDKTRKPIDSLGIRSLAGKMLLIIREKASEEIINKISEDLKGYIKVVVDIRRKILSAGGKMHVDGERMLLEDGSKQPDIWGGGLDIDSGEVDFDSVINLRPGQNNSSREVLDSGIRKQMEEIVHALLR